MRLANKEAKWLIIFATIFVIIGISLSIVIQSVTNKTFVKQYEEYFQTAATFERETLKDEEPLTTKLTFKDKNKEVVGYVFVGGKKVSDIPGAAGPSELTIEVVVSSDFKILNAKTVVNEHTPSYMENVLNYFKKLPGTLLLNYKEVDEVAGASQFSMPVVREVLDKVTLYLTGKEPNPAEDPLEPHELIFGEGTTKEVDSTFTPTEIVTKKEIIKDSEGNELGYTYTATNYRDVPYSPNAELTLVVGISSEGKILGIVEAVNKHTQSENFYLKYTDIIANIKNIDVEDLNIELQAGATVSYGALKEIFDAIKEAEGL